MEQNISIMFELKSPEKYPQSIINTVVLLLREIATMSDYNNWDELNIKIYNNAIEKAKAELDNLKIITIE